MTAKEYLLQVQKADMKAKIRRREIERLEELSKNLSSRPTDNEKVQSSGNKDRVANITIVLMEKKRDLANMLQAEEDVRAKIITQIESMKNLNHSKVLYYRYVEDMTYKQIADEMDYEAGYIEELHRKALKAFNKTQYIGE